MGDTKWIWKQFQYGSIKPNGMLIVRTEQCYGMQCIIYIVIMHNEK